MRLLQDGVVAALAAIGLTAVIFLLVSAVVHPRRRGTIPAAALVPACGTEEKLEYTVRTLERSRYEEGGFARIIIVDCGLSDESRRVAELLCREAHDVLLARPEELPELLTEENRYGRRDDHHGHSPVRRFPE